MSKKICTACNKDGEVLNRAHWVKKIGRKEHPPSHFVPNVNDLVSVDIQRTSKDAGKFIYYFAANSKNMLGKDKEMIYPHEAYGNFQNSGVCQLDTNGFCKIYISMPIEYYVKEDRKKYKPHVHYKLSTKDGKWGKTNYTIQVTK